MTILACSCESEFQDKHYGFKYRVFNPCESKTPGTSKFRCTVCEREVTFHNKEKNLNDTAPSIKGT